MPLRHKGGPTRDTTQEATMPVWALVLIIVLVILLLSGGIYVRR